ncbi:thymidylate synthase, partial [Chryseobacterium koreense]
LLEDLKVFWKLLDFFVWCGFANIELILKIMNKYHKTLEKILTKGKVQENKKGNITYLLNEHLSLKPADLLEIFEGHGIARNKLKTELELFQSGERLTERYREAGITWWDYCGPILVNSYPTYFEQLPDLIKKINIEKRNSKNYVLFLGKNDTDSNQQPCLSLIQFQIDQGKLVVSAYQRSSDANLGLPADIYHLYLISRQIDLPLKSISLFLGNVHVYENNRESTLKLLNGESVKFALNVN